MLLTFTAITLIAATLAELGRLAGYIAMLTLALQAVATVALASTLYAFWPWLASKRRQHL